MNADSKQIATTEPRTSIHSVALSNGSHGASLAPESLGDVVRFAEVMCKADIALPPHLRGNAGACMAVALQALEWHMSPFQVAAKSYAVKGAIAYEAQLIAAVVNTRSGIKGRPKYEYFEEGDAMWCRVTATLGEDICTYDSPALGGITPKNSPLWKTDPRQQLGYYSIRSWARRHCPEVILGVYDRDEVESFQGPDNAKDVTPSLAERLAIARSDPQMAASEREGFDPSFVARETGAASTAILGETPEPSDVAAPSPDDGRDVAPPVDAAANPSEEPAEAADLQPETPAPEAQDGPDAAASPAELITRNLMVECMEKFLHVATDPKVPDPIDRRGNVVFAKNVWKDELKGRQDFVKACFETADKVVKGLKTAEDARTHLESLVA